MAADAENTGRPLRVLIIEDSEDDLDLLVRELRRSGFDPSYQCVKTAADLNVMLDRQQWDLFIGDYTMPGFSGTQALSIVRSRGIEAPFIFVSGTIGEDVAVTAMRTGAQDYVTKGNLKRLGPAIERELRESDARREHARAEADRQLAEDKFRQILMLAADAIIVFDEDLRIIVFNQGAEAIFGYRADEVVGQPVDLLLPSGAVAASRKIIDELASLLVAGQKVSQFYSLDARRKNGEEFPAEFTASALIENGKTMFTAIIRDISERKRAEADRQLAEDRFRQILMLADDAIISFDESLRIVIFNQGAEEIFGYRANEVMGQFIDLLMPHGNTAARREIIAKQVSSPPEVQRMNQLENIFGRRKNGEKFPVDLTISKLIQDGKATFTIIVRDISERKRAEADRQRAEDRFRQILMIAADAIISFDKDMRIVIFNQGAEAIFGYRADEAVGQLIHLLMPSSAVAAQSKIIAELLSAPPTVQTPNQLENMFGRRKNGENFPVELTISRLIQEGKATFTAVIRDISERKRAERQLRLLTRAVEQSANLTILTSADGTIEYVNPKFCEVMGYSADEVIGKKPSLWKSGEMDENIFAVLWQTILAGNEWRGEFQNRRRDGERIIVSATISPVKDEQGNITHFLCLQEDITRLRQIEIEHRRSQRLLAIGQLTGGFAHDFNNLLTIAIGNLDLLLEEPAAQTPHIQEFGKAALDSVLRGAGLTRNLLAYARGQILQPMAFDLNELVSRTTNLLRRTLGEQIEIETILASDLWLAHADPEQLVTALTNLAINSRDAMRNGGRLTIETANRRLDEEYAAANAEVAPGDYLMLTVTDTGEGMSLEIVNRVFEPFFTTKEQGKGTGLGLSMVYGFVKQSHGHIKIYSEPGHGTTIRLYLLRVQDGAAPASEEIFTESGTAASAAKILVVDDNPDVRGVVVKQLTSFGYSVMESQDGPSALDIIRNDETIDLLFTDIVMPGGMTGVELAREAQKLRPLLKILLTSGFAEATLQNHGQPDGTINVLSKPYRRQELARKIREVLSWKT